MPGSLSCLGRRTLKDSEIGELGLRNVISRGNIRRVVWLVMMLASVIMIFLTAYGTSAKSSPAIEATRSGQNFVITEISPGSEIWYAGGRAGDFIVEINGSAAGEFPSLPSVIDSLNVTPSLIEPSVRIMIGVETSALLRQTLSLLLLTVVFALMSLFVFSRANRTSEVVLFAYFTAAIAATLAIGPASLANHAWARLLQGATTSIASVYFLAFFIEFARNSETRTSKLSANLPEASSILSLILGSLWIATATAVPELFPVLRVIALVLLGASLLGALVILPARYRRAPKVRKEQLRIASAGTVIGIFPFIWLSIIPQIITGKPIIAAETSVLGLSLIPLSFGYSKSRNQLLGISQLIHRSATYVLITTLVIVLYGSILSILNRFADESETLRNIELLLLFTMFAGIPLISGIRTRALAIADRLLYPQSLDRESLLDTLTAEFPKSSSTVSTLDRSLNAIGQSLGLRYVSAVIPSKNGDLRSEYGIRPPGYWAEDVT